MSEMISWENFRKRRKLDLKAVIQKLGLKTYEDVASHFNSLWVQAPPREEYDVAAGGDPNEDAAMNAQSLVEAEGKKKPLAKKASPRRKTSAAKKKPEDNPDEVWEDGLDGSYSEKKTTRKTTTRKTSTRKTSTRKKT